MIPEVMFDVSFITCNFTFKRKMSAFGWMKWQERYFAPIWQARQISCCKSCVSLGILIYLKYFVSSAKRKTLIWATTLGMLFMYIVMVQEYYLGNSGFDRKEIRVNGYKLRPVGNIRQKPWPKFTPNVKFIK